MAPSEIGATQGNRISKRTNHLPRKSTHQRHRKDVGEHDDEELRNDGDQQRVLQRQPEGLAVDDDPSEILEADEMHFAAGDRRVGQAVVKREQEREADQQHDIEDRRREHGSPQPALVVGRATVRLTGTSGLRDRRHCSTALDAPAGRRDRSERCRCAVRRSRAPRPPSISVRILVGIFEITCVSGAAAFEHAVDQPIGAEIFDARDAEGNDLGAFARASISSGRKASGRKPSQIVAVFDQVHGRRPDESGDERCWSGVP